MKKYNLSKSKKKGIYVNIRDEDFLYEDIYVKGIIPKQKHENKP